MSTLLSMAQPPYLNRSYCLKLLDKFGHISMRRFATFLGDLFSIGSSRRQMLERSLGSSKSSETIRGSLARVVSQPDLHSQFRKLQCGAPVFIVELNEYIALYFDFNFGDGKKDLLFGVLFNYYSGESLSDS
jgi:hypothetical protein